MAKNNLAGLAALGALGMMMSKGKGKGDPSGVQDTEMLPSTPERDPLEMANNSQESMDIRDSLTRGAPGTSETVSPTSKPRVRSSKPRGPNPALQSNIDPESMRRMVTGMGGYSGMDEAGRPYRPGMKKGGVVKMAKGGLASSASKRADGIASKGKTRCKIC